MVLLLNFSSFKYNTRQDQFLFAQILHRLTFGGERKFPEMFQTKPFSLLKETAQSSKITKQPCSRKIIENSNFCQCLIATTKKIRKKNSGYQEKANFYWNNNFVIFLLKATQSIKHRNKILINFQHIFHVIKFPKKGKCGLLFVKLKVVV